VVLKVPIDAPAEFSEILNPVILISIGAWFPAMSAVSNEVVNSTVLREV
jgi:hypothetical protein